MNTNERTYLLIKQAITRKNSSGEDYIEYVDVRLDLDTITSLTLNESSTLTSYPVVRGANIADNMYRTPETISISGKFSLLSKTNSYNVEGKERMSYIQNLYTSIKNNARLVTIVQRFRSYSNYVLHSISWTMDKSSSSLSYSFDFTKVFMVVLNEEDYKLDLANFNYYPNVNSTSTSSSNKEDIGDIWDNFVSELSNIFSGYKNVFGGE